MGNCRSKMSKLLLSLCVLAVFVSTQAAAKQAPSPDGIIPEVAELVQDGSDEEATDEEESDEKEAVGEIWCDDPAGCITVFDSGSGRGEAYPALDYNSNETIKVADIYCEGDIGCIAVPIHDDENATVVESSGSGSSAGSGSSTSSGSGSSMSVGDDSGSSSMFMQMGSGMVVPEESGDDDVEVVADVYCGSNDNTTGCQIITDPYNDANKVTEIHEGYEHVGVMGKGTIGGVEDADGYWKDGGTETGNVTHAATVVYEQNTLGALVGDPLNQFEESGSGSRGDEEGSGSDEEGNEEESGEVIDEGDIYCTGTDCEIVMTNGKDSIADIPAPFKSDDEDEVVAE